MSKMLLAFFLILLGIGVGFFIFNQSKIAFENLSSEEMRSRIIQERNLAIAKAKEEGNYRCCIEPPCTMCYMEANQWNNQTAGTCACDDLIAQGKEPCPQCEREFCGGSKEESACKIKN